MRLSSTHVAVSTTALVTLLAGQALAQSAPPFYEDPKVSSQNTEAHHATLWSYDTEQQALANDRAAAAAMLPT